MASKKSPNFTELNKTVLIELVDSRKGIIESNQNDGEMISKKNNEWENKVAITMPKDNEISIKR
jgi:hypothetical protein